MFDTSTDSFDSFENFLYQSTCCLCYNLFHREHLPSAENVWITNFTTKGASLSFYFFAAPPPAGAEAPPAGGPGLVISPGIILH